MKTQAAEISIHALLAESDQQSRGSYIRTEKFLSTLSLRRATVYLALIRYLINFYPRSPCGERRKSNKLAGLKLDFYPRSPCGERLTPARILSRLSLISIHALLAESDMFAGVLSHYSRISIHALLAESDISVFWTALSRPLFLSTLSLRRATHYDNYNLHCVEISIHALLAESDGTMRLPQPWEAISIHALLAESDGQTGGYRTARMSFLSTLSLRRATNTLRGLRRCTANFYPRSPCGERPQAHAPGRPAETFLSTLSLRRATLEDVAQRVGISYFYPRSPCGERLDSAL